MKSESTYQIVNRVIERHFGPFQPNFQPSYTITAMLKRSLLQLKIEEDQAQLDTLRIILFDALSLLSERKHCSDWREISNMIDQVAALERSIEDETRTLNDSGLWEQEGGNA